MLWFILLFTASESIELFILFSYTNATQIFKQVFFNGGETNLSVKKPFFVSNSLDFPK